MKRRCLFLDRDGVINVKAPEGDYVKSVSELRMIPAAADWIRLANALGLLVVVITNQRGVARGRMTAQDLEEIHTEMKRRLAREGARIDGIFVCPHEEGACNCRKPRPGLIEQAVARWEIDLARSLFLGDSDSDAELARRCGIPFLRVAGGRITGPAELPAQKLDQ